MALKAILIDEEHNDDDLNKEIQNLETASLSKQLRRVLQSKAQRYGKGKNRVFNSKGRKNFKSNYPTKNYNKDKVIQQTQNNYNNVCVPNKQKEQEPEEVCFECK